MSFQNDYILRQVASPQSKSCTVCYKPTANVLITADNLDFFYVCLSHLKDESFATPSPNEEFSRLKKEEGESLELIRDLELRIAKLKPSIFNNIPGFKPEKKEGDAYDNLVKEKDIHEKKLAEIRDSISGFKFKNYVLNGDMFKVRLRSYITKKMNEKRLKEISEPSYFPSAPSGVPDA